MRCRRWRLLRLRSYHSSLTADFLRVGLAGVVVVTTIVGIAPAAAPAAASAAANDANAAAATANAAANATVIVVLLLFILGLFLQPRRNGIRPTALGRVHRDREPMNRQGGDRGDLGGRRRRMRAPENEILGGEHWGGGCFADPV